MRNKEEIFEWIEDYLNGRLSGEDLTEFEEKLNKEKEFANQLQLHRELAMVVSDSNQDKLEGILDQLGDEFIGKSAIVKKPFWQNSQFLAIAASIVALIAVGVLLNQWNTKPNGQELFTQYYDFYEAPGALRSGEANLDSLLIEGIDLYNKKSFDEALIFFDQILSQNPNRPFSAFFKGMCLIEMNQTLASIDAFQIVLDDNQSLFVDHASWYISLAYLKNNQSEKAKPILTELAQRSGSFAILAKELLTEL